MVCVIAITLLTLVVGGFGQTCKYDSSSTGYCREKDDCFSASVQGNCENNYVCCEDSQTSTHRCKEYGKLVFGEDYNGALTARSETHQVTKCYIEAVPLIVGGVKAKPKEFPHMVAIGYGDSFKNVEWLCGGSLISENFVLSAAHCSESEESGPAKFARIGASNLKKDDPAIYQDFTIIKRIVHPKYKPPSRYNDLALFELSSSIKTDGFVRPACLHTTPDEFIHKKATATGWGKRDFNDENGSDNLMKVALNIIDYSACNFSFSGDMGGKSLANGIVPSQFCAGEMKGGKDTCQGDSGGPLQIHLDDPYCMYSIIGVTSFGKFCGYKNSPAVYSRVSYFVPWIESVIYN